MEYSLKTEGQEKVKQRIAIFCIRGHDNFVQPIVRHLSKEHDVRFSYGDIYAEVLDNCAWADIVWMEWADELAVSMTNASGLLHEKHVILHCHSYEILTGVVERINWGEVDQVICPSDYIADMLKEVAPAAKIVSQFHAVPTGIDLAKFPLLNQPGRVRNQLAVVAHLSDKKGIMLLLQSFAALVEIDGNYDFTLHIAGDWQSSRYENYFNHFIQQMGLSDRVKHYGWVDHTNMQEWLADKDFIICTSPFESQGVGIMEAMASGIQPVVHFFPGADLLFPESCLWLTTTQFTRLICEDNHSPEQYREHIATNYEMRTQLEKIDRLIPSPVNSQTAEPMFLDNTKDFLPSCIDEHIPSSDTKPSHCSAQLSVLLMVKNEEKNLARCLKSVQGIADEIVVVDTGSSDSTIQIAKEYGASVHLPDDLDSLYIDTPNGRKLNFSAGRNLCLSLATKEWVLFIDADEELVVPDPAALRDWFSRLPKSFNAAAFTLRDIQAGKVVVQFSVQKAFRNGKVKYEGIVHNQPKFEGSAALHTEVYFNHYGYDLTPEEKAAKAERTLGLLQKRLLDNPKDYKVHFYLSQAYGFYTPDNVEGIINNTLEYIQHKEDIAEFNYSAYFTLVQALMRKGDAQEAHNWLSTSRRILPNDLDLALAQLEFGLWTERKDIMYDGGRDFLRIYELYNKAPQEKQNRFIYSHNEEARAFCLFHMSTTQLKGGISHLTQLQETLEETPRAFKLDMQKNLESALKNTGVTLIH